MSFKITFLGTGGGRHTAMFQTRCTGGMLIEHGLEKHHLHIDPGPGALTQMRRIHYDPADTDSVVVSHAHPDHYSDAEVVIEGMTKGGWMKRGHIYGSQTVINGEGDLGPCISRYHLDIADGVDVFRPGDELCIDGMDTTICNAVHSDPTNVGFKFHTEYGIVSYVSDTLYSDELADQYIGTRVLILPVTAPDDAHINFHLCTDDAIRFVSRVKPEITIFIHLGIMMIKNNPDKQAEKCQERTGFTTVAGKDLMTVELDDDCIRIDTAVSYDDDWIPPSSP